MHKHSRLRPITSARSTSAAAEAPADNKSRSHPWTRPTSPTYWQKSEPHLCEVFLTESSPLLALNRRHHKQKLNVRLCSFCCRHCPSFLSLSTFPSAHGVAISPCVDCPRTDSHTHRDNTFHTQSLPCKRGKFLPPIDVAGGHGVAFHRLERERPGRLLHGEYVFLLWPWATRRAAQPKLAAIEV